MYAWHAWHRILINAYHCSVKGTFREKNPRKIRWKFRILVHVFHREQAPVYTNSEAGKNTSGSYLRGVSEKRWNPTCIAFGATMANGIGRYGMTTNIVPKLLQFHQYTKMINHNRAMCVIASVRKPLCTIENTIWKDGFIENRRFLRA